MIGRFGFEWEEWHVPLAIQAHNPVAAAGRRRGFALLLVLVVMMVCTIVAYTTLSTSAMQAHANAHARATVEARLAAESGVNLAMHYLMRPHEAPVALAVGAAGDVHYPGQSDVSLSESSSFDVSVTNTAPATYSIRAVGRARDGEGEWSEVVVRTTVTGFGRWQAKAGAQFTGNVRLNSNVRIEGGLATDGNFTEGSVSSGTIWAANHAGRSGWAAPPLLPEMTVPPFASISLVRSALEYNRYYMYQGQLCRADLLTGDVTGLPTPSPANPGRVFIYEGTDTLNISTYDGGGGGLLGSLLKVTLGLLGAEAPAGDFENMTWRGTLVILRADLHIYGKLEIRPQAGMPGLLVAGVTHFPAAAGELRVRGLAYLNGGLSRPSSKPDGDVRIEGALLRGDLNGSRFGTNFKGDLEIRLESADVVLPDLFTQGIRYERLQVENWQQLVN